jgi:hypothetical protein
MRQVEEAEYDRLVALDGAVRRVLAQKGDDVCWRDVYTELAGLVGVDPTPHLICDERQFLANCRRFHQSLKSGGDYVPVFVREAQG